MHYPPIGSEAGRKIIWLCWTTQGPCSAHLWPFGGSQWPHTRSPTHRCPVVTLAQCCSLHQDVVVPGAWMDLQRFALQPGAPKGRSQYHMACEDGKGATADWKCEVGATWGKDSLLGVRHPKKFHNWILFIGFSASVF